MTWPEICYGAVTLEALVDLVLVMVAMHHADNRQTLGRLIALAGLLTGFAASAAQRLQENASLTWGLALVGVSLLTLAFFLPGKRR